MLVEDRIRESIAVKECVLQNKEQLCTIIKVSDLIKEVIKRKGKILLCGNGGSAADSLHIAAEFIGRFQCERKPLPAISLNANMAALTAMANDFEYEEVFARAVEGLMRPEDILIGISTSGNSENVYRAIIRAKEIGGITVAFSGKTGGKIKELADYCIMAPSDSTARIQECHIMVAHIICEMVEMDKTIWSENFAL